VIVHYSIPNCRIIIHHVFGRSGDDFAGFQIKKTAKKSGFGMFTFFDPPCFLGILAGLYLLFPNDLDSSIYLRMFAPITLIRISIDLKIRDRKNIEL